LRRVDREQLARSDSRRDRKIIKLLERPRRLIATVLIGHEAFDSLLAVLALAVVMDLRIGPASPWASAGIALAVALPLVVLIAEVSAKTLAAKNAMGWARTCVFPLSVFAVF